MRCVGLAAEIPQAAPTPLVYAAGAILPAFWPRREFNGRPPSNLPPHPPLAHDVSSAGVDAAGEGNALDAAVQRPAVHV